MMKAGWPTEVQWLIDKGAPVGAKPFQFIGYSEIRERLTRGGNPEEAIPAIQQATRRFAKRQITWFRREPGVRWLTGFGDDADVAAAALKIA